MALARVGRLATTVAVVALLANAGLLAAAGLAAGRTGLLLTALGLAAAAGVVQVAWRRHERALHALAADRQELRDAVLAMRTLIRRDPE